MSDTPETDEISASLLYERMEKRDYELRQHARRLERDRDEQCRLLGMSAERECDLRGKLERERALADSLAEGLRKMVLYSEALILRIQDRSDINFKTLNECIDLFNEWKEARSE